MIESSPSLRRILNTEHDPLPDRHPFPVHLAISQPAQFNALPEIHTHTPTRPTVGESRSHSVPPWTPPEGTYGPRSPVDRAYRPRSLAGSSPQHQTPPGAYSSVNTLSLHSKHPSISPTWSPDATIQGLPPFQSDVRTGLYAIRADTATAAALPDHYPSHDPPPSPSSQKRGFPEIDAFEYQTAERASVRIAAAAVPTSYSHYYPPNQRYHPERDVREPSHTPSSDRTHPRQGSQKRGVFDVEDAEEPPKSKRKLSAKPREQAGSWTSASLALRPIKRGYTTKKRGEAAPMAALNESEPDTMYTLAIRADYNRNESPYQVVSAKFPNNENLRVEIQEARCMASRYRNDLADDITRCISCIRRWAGDTCRFQFVRFLFRDCDQKVRGFGFQERELDFLPSMEYPDAWNIPLRDDHIHETKKTIAAALLPTLCEELRHIGKDAVVYRPRESDVRATCDTCLTSIFSCSWMCRICGREACAECFQQVTKLTVVPEGASDSQICDLKVLRDKHAHLSPTFLMCMKKKDHRATDFSPMSRFNKPELVTAIDAMKKLLKDEAIDLLEPSTVVDAPNSVNATKVEPASTSIRYGAQTPSDDTLSPLSNDSDTTLISDGNVPPLGSDPAVASGSRTEIPAHEIRRFKASDLTEEIFRPLWAQGDPLLVTNVGSKLKIDWSPQYLWRSTEESMRITVAEFFSNFGQYEGRTSAGSSRLDWPPSSDFKTSFPELYEDFSQAVPIPNYVRRDGVLNLASHFPSNTVAPDLGPKMYNANANQVAFGTKGSTRLHMDMADALNIMTYAAPGLDGEEGSAAWDLFRAQDSDEIRQFLRARYTTVGLDPIHSQQVYLDDEARRELYEQCGVKSYRVYQKAGEAVFIPAGCAHQVRNLSDCIKVAIDFVSPENIARCEKLTREFREQNQRTAWKEDVLQLRTMMWFAWISCCRQEKKSAPVVASSDLE
ncbi:hypothetical protein B0H17DRAFT_1089633 [Mycena rosella]|uniref:JmjC domain-containing protein n=1 Tax=Mycena rosella TaxID=1033263 RepID=A0AAD7CWF6_MYCRO|nr:hypothetical protein B0H17DRAFT_1089633 [Mycena rosella]